MHAEASLPISAPQKASWNALTGIPAFAARHARDVISVLLLLVLLAPVAWLIQMAFRPAADALELNFQFTPTLDAFKALWQDAFARSFGNSLLVSSLSTGLSMLIGVPAAYALSRWKFRQRSHVALWILCTRMAPPIAFTIPFFLAFRWLGMLDTVWALVIVYLTFNLAIVTWMMQGFFDAIPTALEEAAWLDGCGIWSAFWHVTLPLTRPGLVATAVLCFIFSWSDFFFALILTRTQAVTAPVAIVNFLQYDGWEWTKIAAAGTLVMLPVLIFTALVRKYLVHGLTAGGVKD
ncbi:carbohydrate ABC transporter permease [Diaphorobacter sp. HDW4B]|uniref:carbohydrate ABC transporter permease n=1 Tax=Diaphorobacter sp. HDW4B TaxID=2714925 RepID=UPI001F107003|nr:carbohydrate ABC transporter permease [Diaphorobacter sp. HDW4B]